MEGNKQRLFSFSPRHFHCPAVFRGRKSISSSCVSGVVGAAREDGASPGPWKFDLPVTGILAHALASACQGRYSGLRYSKEIREVKGRVIGERTVENSYYDPLMLPPVHVCQNRACPADSPRRFSHRHMRNLKQRSLLTRPLYT